MERLLAIPLSDFVSWWPLWSVGLLAGLALIFAGRPSRARRVFGIGLLVLMPLMAYSFAVWSDNGCYEGYADSTECDLFSAWFIIGLVLLAGIAATAGWGLYRLVRLIANRVRDLAPRSG